MHENHIKRLEGKEDLTRKSYDELKKKSEEKLENYDNLRALKLTTFNHFLATWEIKNQENTKDEITELKNAFPLALRKYFSEEIEENKDSLK